jgi:putative ABC transport system permease protein
MPTAIGIAQGLRRMGVAVEFALQSLWSARRRLWLVVLGAAIGFGAIDSMLIIGSSVQARLQASLDSLGGDVLSIEVSSDQTPAAEQTPNDPGGRSADGASTRLDPVSLLNLIRAKAGVESAVWVRRGMGCATAGDNVKDLEHNLASTAIQDLLAFRLASGRLLHSGDSGQPNMLLGASAFDNLRSQVPGLSIGSIVQYCGQRYRIVGVLGAHPGSDLVQALQINSSALVSSQKPDEELPESGQSLLIRLRGGTPAQAYSHQLVSQLKALMPGHTVQARGAWEFMKLRQEQVTSFARFLAILGSVSLLVGALGIANMMLVSVAERRSEIGLRLAVGAKRVDVVLQFIFEGVAICLIGAIVGFLLGWLVAVVALDLGGFTVSVSSSVLGLAAAIAVACGVISGAYPAFRAASIDPVVSLQG